MFEIAGYFSAEEASGDGMVGIAAETAAVILLVDIDEQRTGVGAIEGTDGMDGAGHVHMIIVEKRAFSYQPSAFSCFRLSPSASEYRHSSPFAFLSFVVAAGSQFLFWLPAASGSGGIYKYPFRTLIRFDGTSWLRSSPLVAAPANDVACLRDHVQISMLAL